jgi:uncharacterized membrane protein YphA (DoxX/SURF4 family)
VASGRNDLLRRTGIPAPAMNAVFVSAVEFVFGLLLAVGLLMPLSCLMLRGVMVVALGTVILPGVQATSLTSWLRSVLYLPEVLYLVILVWLFFSGAGWFSVDFVMSGVVQSGLQPRRSAARLDQTARITRVSVAVRSGSRYAPAPPA